MEDKTLELLKKLLEAANKLDTAYLNLSVYGEHLGGNKYDEINNVIADVEEYLEFIQNMTLIEREEIK